MGKIKRSYYQWTELPTHAGQGWTSMKLKEFRITNFRSIVDTGWCPFSPDGVTVLVGQNESGKSSLLHALAL